VGSNLPPQSIGGPLLIEEEVSGGLERDRHVISPIKGVESKCMTREVLSRGKKQASDGSKAVPST
jgi:hypothetical protein